MLPNLPLPDPFRGLDFWHGTPSERLGRKIIESGALRPREATLLHRKGFTASRSDRVYLTHKLHYALIYARGHASMMPWRTGKDRYGVLFHLDTARLDDLDPDEDAVGDLIEHCSLELSRQSYGPTPRPTHGDPLFVGCKAFTAFAERELTRAQFERAASGSTAWKASAGKKLLARMGDSMKLAVILWDQYGRVAHRGPVQFDGCWLIDRAADWRSFRSGLGRELGDDLEEVAPYVLEHSERIL